MPGYYEIHKSGDEKFIFKLKTRKKEVLLTSQPYPSKQHALEAIEAARINAPKYSQYLRKHSLANEPYFVLSAGNGETLGLSEMYDTDTEMERAIALAKELGATKEAKDKA